jgi:hypothetical protein
VRILAAQEKHSGSGGHDGEDLGVSFRPELYALAEHTVIVVLPNAKCRLECDVRYRLAAYCLVLRAVQRFKLSLFVIPSAVPSASEGKPRDLVFSYQLAARSFHPGLNLPDQPQLLLAPPALQLLFPRDCFMHIVEALPIHQTCGIVLIGESLRPVRFVLKNTPVQIVCHSNVEAPAGAALENVDVEAIFAGIIRHCAYRQTNAVPAITLNL